SGAGQAESTARPHVGRRRHGPTRGVRDHQPPAAAPRTQWDMNALSICSGIGGIDLGLTFAIPSYRTVCHVEFEPARQDVLLARMADGLLDRARIWGDLKQFD